MVCEIEGIIEYNLPVGLTFTVMFHVKHFSRKLFLAYGITLFNLVDFLYGSMLEIVSSRIITLNDKTFYPC